MKTHKFELNQKTRCFSGVAAFQVLMTFISPAMWIFTSPQSILARVSQLACSSTALGWCWIIAGACVVPFIVMQLVHPTYKHRRIVTKISNAGSLFGGLTWFFIAFIARNLDYEFIVLNFLINGIGAFVMAALLADGLNDEQLELPIYRKRTAT